MRLQIWVCLICVISPHSNGAVQIRVGLVLADNSREKLEHTEPVQLLGFFSSESPPAMEHPCATRTILFIECLNVPQTNMPSSTKVPALGCGVFQNKPADVGSALARALAKGAGAGLDEVVLAGVPSEFADAATGVQT